MEFAAEYSILKESKRLNNKNLLQLDGTVIGREFIALRLKKYEMDFRHYLTNSRNPQELNIIFELILEGVRELHKMGYVHRDLKPDNILISFNPFEVVVIDFNRAVRIENISSAITLGTPGYMPLRERWVNGSI